jgi:NAD(P)-dependent dehydrogenase (short-subunit alcohol dehydrogenase family)
MLFSAELRRRLQAQHSGVDVLCLHPGNVLTDVVRSLPAAVQQLYRALLSRILFTPEQGGVPLVGGRGWVLQCSRR